MTCNGSNHRPGCNCGWGGVFYGLGLRVGGPYWGRSDSYTNPNARCPYCSALVYFYKSPSGGSVYFDELGPPWPKHPCVDAGSHSLRTIRTRQSLVVPLWATAGWHPLQCESIETLKGAPDVVVLATSQGKDRKQLFARMPKAPISCDSPILWRRVDGQRGHYEISTLDLSDIVFKEVRFEAFDKLSDVEKHIRGERLNAHIKAFDIRMASLKHELLNGVSISGLEAKLDATIAKFQQLLRDYGDPTEISRGASEALKSFVEREIQTRDRAQRAQAIYEDLRAEGTRLEKELAEVGIDLKPYLRKARKWAVANGLSLDEGKALLRNRAQSIVNAATKVEMRHRASEELRGFITEVCSAADQLEGKGKALLESTLVKALHKGNPDISVIKELLLQQARKYLEEAAAVLSLRQEKARQAEARAAEISSRIDEIIKRHPAMDRNELTAALARMTNSKSPLEKIHAALDEIVRKWVAALTPAQRPVRPTGPQRYEPQTSATPKNVTCDAGGRGRSNGGTGRASQSPFNAALADKLRFALEQAGKSGLGP